MDVLYPHCAGIDVHKRAHAQQVKNVPGKKTDTADCVWLAQLLRHGLLPGSFVPEASLRELRDLTRARVSLVRERPPWPIVFRKYSKTLTSNSAV
jgi:Transposase